MCQETKRIIAFFAVSAAFSWLLAAVFLISGGEPGAASSNILAMVYALVPASAAIIMQKWIYHERLRPDLGLFFKPNRWFFAAWIFAAAIVFAVNEVGLYLPWNEFTPDMSGFIDRIAKIRGAQAADQIRTAVDVMPFPFFWLLVVQGLIGGLTVGAVVGLGSEIGFRGFVLRQMESAGFWKKAFVTGILWGIWSAPSAYISGQYPDHPVAGLGMMALYCLLAAPLYLWFRLKSGSVVGSAIFAGTLGGMAAIPLVYVSGGSDLTMGISGLPGMIVLVIANALVFVFDRFVSDEPVTVAVTAIAEKAGEDAATGDKTDAGKPYEE